MNPIVVVVTVSRLYDDGTTSGTTFSVPIDWIEPPEFGDPIQRSFLPSLPERSETLPILEQLGGLVEDVDE